MAEGGAQKGFEVGESSSIFDYVRGKLNNG
jgi:hypothetical protein